MSVSKSNLKINKLLLDYKENLTTGKLYFIDVESSNFLRSLKDQMLGVDADTVFRDYKKNLDVEVYDHVHRMVTAELSEALKPFVVVRNIGISGTDGPYIPMYVDEMWKQVGEELKKMDVRHMQGKGGTR